MGNIEARLVRPSNGQLRANIGRVNEENLNPYVLPVGYGQNQGLNWRNNMNLIITQDEPSNRLSSGGFDDVMREDNPMVNGEGLKLSRLYLDNSEGNNNGNGDKYQNEISVGLAHGGLCLGWKSSISVTLRSFFNSHIDVLINEDINEKCWRYISFYGAPQETRREDLWQLLRQLNDCPIIPWLVFRDFNEILFSFEKKDGLLRNDRQMQAFSVTFEDCELDDLGYDGVWYTWEHGRFASNNIREMLDRAVANGVWSTTFQLYKVSHFTHSFSDHSPIVVDMEDDGHRNWLWHFKFEAAWLLEKTYKTEMARLWNDSDGTIPERLSYVCCSLDKWFKRVRREKRINVTSLRSPIAPLGSLTPTDAMLEGMLNAKLHMNIEGVIDEDDILLGVDRCITDSMNADLDRPFTKEEIFSTLLSMSPLKALGDDGLGAVFYQRFWHILGDEVAGYCIGLLNGEFPINLINHTTFVLGRLISDNIVAAYEILYFMKNKRFGKEGSFALKLDMSKVERIMRIITSVTYSIVVNGNVRDKFTPSRGLRQGDPLSPYLFLVYSEGLLTLLRFAKSSGAIKGARVVRGAPRVTHLLFADNRLIFGYATAMRALNVLKVLQSYTKCSGQLVNFEKSRVFFSSNIDMGNRLDVKRILRVNHADN
ncbi:uncharacterized protein LOC105797658 [Gossypium raimondii]|uniref:uncharacterized protein LOC105797658 n=1 Tax=Gossypium raimondii TaxID=29730 RepID=UPI00063AAD35|nr:uncharacterized protein LOC105797658 [Gossypium raimondii]